MLSGITSETASWQSLVEEFQGLQPKLKLLIICFSYSWGGLEIIACRDAIRLAELGFDVQVLCLQNTRLAEFLLPRTDLRVFPMAFMPRNFLDLTLRKELSRFILNGVNIIHIHQPSLLGSIAPWLWNEASVGLVVSRHIRTHCSKRDLFHRLIYRRVDSLLVMSENLRKNVIETHAISKNKVKQVPLGLDFSQFDPYAISEEVQARWKKLWLGGEEHLFIGMVGRLDPAKGQETFIKAAARLLTSVEEPEKLRFVLVGDPTVGSDTAYLERLKALISEFRLEACFSIMGFQTKIPEIMAALDICVMPSKEETFGLVAIEAMAMQCGVVVSQGGSSEELVGKEEEFGLTVRPEDIFGLQKKIRELVENTRKRKQLGEQARHHVLKHFDRLRRVRKTLQIYYQTLEARQILS